MKNTKINSRTVATTARRIMTALSVALFATVGALAQNSLPAPGSGGTFKPAPVNKPANGIGWNPGPGFNSAPRPGFNNNPGPNNGPGWGPNGIGWNPSPGFNNGPGWVNQGTVNVIACGYDNQGVWRTLPLHVAYTYNGIQYDVTVLNAWNPWTQAWNIGVDMPAYNTSYYLRGQTYSFYAPLSTGTYYFNL